MESYESFIERTRKLVLKCQTQTTVTFDEIFTTLGYSSHYILILFLTLPFLQPVPLPGLSTIFGIIILTSSLCIILSRKLYIPCVLKKHALPASKGVKIGTRLLKISTQTERWLHPRGRFMTKHRLLRIINGAFLFVGGILLALPLPIPFTNTLPAYAIACISLGSLKEDGLFVSLGWAILGIALAYIFSLTSFFIF